MSLSYWTLRKGPQHEWRDAHPERLAADRSRVGESWPRWKRIVDLKTEPESESDSGLLDERVERLKVLALTDPQKTDFDRLAGCAVVRNVILVLLPRRVPFRQGQRRVLR
jgi:hypothetical protein